MTEFIGSEAKHFYDQYKQDYKDLKNANREMDRVRTTHYDIPAHGDSEYRAADRQWQIANGHVRRTIEDAQINVSENLDFYITEAKQDMRKAGIPYSSDEPRAVTHIP